MNEENKRPEVDPLAEENEVGESIAARRLAHLRGQQAEEPVMPYPEESGGPFRRFMRNFLYHYKWHAITAIAVVLMLAILIPQCLTKTSYDVHVLYAGPMFDCDKSSTVAGIENAFSAAMQDADYDGDGKKTISYRPIFLMNAEQLEALRKEYEGREEEAPYINANLLSQNRDLLTSELTVGESHICLLDRSIFEDLRDEGWIVPLDELLSEAEMPAATIGGYGVLLKDTVFGSYFGGLNTMPEDTVLCFRRTGLTTNSMDVERAEERRQNALDLFKRILAFQEPAED